MTDVLEVYGVVAVIYFALLNTAYLLFTIVSWQTVTEHLRQRGYAAMAEGMASPFTPPASVILPAYNEEAGVVSSVHSLLDLRYPELEVVVVNDGSTDGTLAALEREFELVPVRIVLRKTIQHAPVRGAYASRRDSRLLVVDKENGGKADALNCGMEAASYPYVCSVDGDTLIEEDALLRVALPAIEDPERVIATGGIIRIVNGCKVEAGRVTEVGLPRDRLATLQVIEYFRAFLVGRTAWSRFRGLLVISGAFGLFKRSTLESAGGYWTDTVGEDGELVVRLHREMRRRRAPYGIEFVPDPVCWTEAPEDLRTLARQRRRWQRGLAEALWRHRGMIGNPRYGVIGTLVLPYFLIFELLGALLIEFPAYLILPLAAGLGLMSIELLLAFLGVAVLYGMVLSVSALALEEFSFRRHTRGVEVIRLLGFVVLDNLGYRQLQSFLRAVGTLDFVVRRRGTWGEMKRRGVGITEVEEGAPR
jgi:cellulose synthase/poly-beta-1,6-N-acetylglucosamine synthase-like glycosyltransferase